MPNTREKLIELIRDTPDVRVWPDASRKIADHLISHGVTFNRDCHWATEQAYKNGKADGVKEFAEKIDKCLKRYSNLHKYANEARHSTEEYADGTPMEMVSVWEVLSLLKWEMVEYETMSTLQENIETIAKERLLTEFEKDFLLLIRELVDNGMPLPQPPKEGE